MADDDLAKVRVSWAHRPGHGLTVSRSEPLAWHSSNSSKVQAHRRGKAQVTMRSRESTTVLDDDGNFAELATGKEKARRAARSSTRSWNPKPPTDWAESAW